MSFSQPENYHFYGDNWEQMYNQLLFSYYQLSQNFRTAVNKNLLLNEQLKQKTQIFNQAEKSLAQNTLKLQSKRTLPQDSQVVQETSKNLEKNQKSDSQKKNRFKRKGKSSISNQYTCTYPDCNRSYDSSVSLNLHIKLKHNGGTKKQRQTYAKMILDAQQNGLQPPKININFPPRFLEDFKTSYQYMKRYSM